jgi:tetratricopeptide (TPR) repeat protein
MAERYFLRNSEKIMEEQRSTGKIRLGIMLSSALAVGFLLGYLASAFVPLVRPPQSPASSASTAPAPRLSPSEIDSALKAAHASLDAGDLQAAWETYHQILLADRSHVEALTHLGIIMMRSNRPDEAIKLYDRALSLDPQYAHALFDKGQALQEKGDAKGATETFRRFLTLVPPDSDDAKRVQGWITDLSRSKIPQKEKKDPSGR